MVVEGVQRAGKYSRSGNGLSRLFEELGCLLRRCLFKVLSMGPIPSHFAFIMDGNRRFAKKQNLAGGDGHKAGFSALISMLNYCYELGVKYVTVYAFSIENFKRGPDEVQCLMDLMLEKIESLLAKESIVNQYGIRVYFIGNLRLLNEPVRVAAEKVMKATAKNNKTVLLVCVAYTSYDEIVHAVQVSCKDKYDQIQALNLSNGCNHRTRDSDNHVKINGAVMPDSKGLSEHGLGGLYVSNAPSSCDAVAGGLWETKVENGAQESYESELDISRTSKPVRRGEFDSDEIQGSGEDLKIKVTDIEKNMYMAVAPDPDILIRSSGETRLSNFLLWQTSFCPLYSPAALWPEIGLLHLVWALLNFQRCQSYLEKQKKKQ